MRELVPAITWHLAIGVALGASIWAVGFGLLAIARARTEAAFAYPLGLLAITGVSALALTAPILGVATGALLAVPLAAGLRRYRPGRRSLAALPTVAAFPFALGLLLHGPTARLDSLSYGDMLGFVAKLVSAQDSLVPLRDLLVEGERRVYADSAQSTIGAALAHLPGFDPVLFHTTALPACLLVALWTGVVTTGRLEASLVLPVLALAVLPYPTFAVESAPMTLALPLAFTLDALLRRPPSRAQILGAVALAGAAAILTKVAALIPLGIVGGFVLVRRMRARELLGAALAGLVVVGLTLLALDVRWYADLLEPRFKIDEALRGLWSQRDVRSTSEAAEGVELVAHCLLLGAVFRLGSRPLQAVVALSVAGRWLVGGLGFEVAIGLGVLLVVLHLRTRPELLGRHGVLLGATAGGLAVAAWFREPAGVRPALVLVLLLFLALAAIFGVELRADVSVVVAAAIVFGLAGFPFLGALVLLAATVAAIVGRVRQARLAIGVAVLAAAVGLGVDRDLHLSTARPALRSEDYEVWSRVRAEVPADGLVFTSLTGKRLTGRLAWNGYPAVARRQVYLAGWYNSRLQTRPEEVDRRLRFNRRVLTGRLAPDAVPLSRRYSSYYAVKWRHERAPRAFVRIYANSLFALYRIRPLLPATRTSAPP